MDPEWAEAELLRRWLVSYGPGTITDLRWWTGWTLAKTLAALTRLDIAEVELDNGPGVALAEDLETGSSDNPSVAMLPGLDPSVMGWKERDWFLGDLQGLLFDSNGNAGPTVWVDGCIVGGWAQRSDGEVAFKLLKDVGREARDAIAAEAAALSEWLGEVRIKPRFRTPIERELTG